MTESVRRQVPVGIALLVGAAAVASWYGMGGQYTVGILIVLVPVTIVAWLARRLPTPLRWIVIWLLVFLVPILVFFNVAVACNATTGFGGPSCWWDHVPWLVRDAIRGAWSTLTGQPLTRDLFPF